MCTVLGGGGNTKHLMFECEQYIEPICSTRKCNEQNKKGRIEKHTLLILYSVRAGARGIMALIQEIKRNVGYRRYKRETTNSAIHCNRIRLLGHLIIIVRKLENLRKY